jgi:predicted nucleic acid-binding protein
MTTLEARTYLEELKELEIVSSSFQVVARALGVRERRRFHWYDSLIVAAALEGQCERLYTEDLQHGQRVESVEIVNPFL